MSCLAELSDSIEDLAVNDNNVNLSTITTVELVIPSEAVGRIIGTKGVHIKMLKQTRNIKKVVIKEIAANSHVLVVSGEIDAVTEVINLAQKAINASQTSLHNKSRAVHSWQPTNSGSKLTPRDVHKTSDRKPKIGSVYYDKEKQKIQEVRKLSSLAEVDPPSQRQTKLSSKQQREEEAAFQLAREQFEAVKAAREKNANK